MEQVGIIRECKDGSAYVKILRSTACGDSCADCNLCGNKEIYQWVENPIGAGVGDTVLLEIPTSSGLVMAFVAYILPVLIAAVACVIYTRFIKSRAAVDILSFATFATSILLIAKSDKIFFSNKKYKSRITEVLKRA